MAEIIKYAEILNPNHVGEFLLAFPGRGSNITVEQLMRVRGEESGLSKAFELCTLQGIQLKPDTLGKHIRGWGQIVLQNPDAFVEDVVTIANRLKLLDIESFPLKRQKETFQNTQLYLELLATNPSLLADINRSVNLYTKFDPQHPYSPSSHYGVIDFLADIYGWPRENLASKIQKPSVKDASAIQRRSGRFENTLEALRDASLAFLGKVTHLPFQAVVKPGNKRKGRRSYNFMFSGMLSEWEKMQGLIRIIPQELSDSISKQLFLLHPAFIFPDDSQDYARVTVPMQAVLVEAKKRFNSILIDIIRLLQQGYPGTLIETGIPGEMPAFVDVPFNNVQMVDLVYNEISKQKGHIGKYPDINKQLVGIAAAEQLIGKVLAENPQVPRLRLVLTNIILERLTNSDENAENICESMGFNRLVTSALIRGAIYDILLDGTSEQITKLSHSFQEATSLQNGGGGNQAIKILHAAQARKLIQGDITSPGLFEIWTDTVSSQNRIRLTLGDMLITQIADGKNLSELYEQIQTKIQDRFRDTDVKPAIDFQSLKPTRHTTAVWKLTVVGSGFRKINRPELAHDAKLFRRKKQIASYI